MALSTRAEMKERIRKTQENAARFLIWQDELKHLPEDERILEAIKYYTTHGQGIDFPTLGRVTCVAYRPRKRMVRSYVLAKMVTPKRVRTPGEQPRKVLILSAKYMKDKGLDLNSRPD